MEDFDIRYSTLDDLEFLRGLFSQEEDFSEFPFSYKEKEEMLKNWIGFSKYKASLSGIIKENPCAIGTLFLMPYRKIAHHCSFFLVVDPEHRGKGIGTSMVKNLLHLAKMRFRLESVHVEVYENGPLIPVLRKLKFEEFARQENYVKSEIGSRARILWEHAL